MSLPYYHDLPRKIEPSNDDVDSVCVTYKYVLAIKSDHDGKPTKVHGGRVVEYKRCNNFEIEDIYDARARFV